MRESRSCSPAAKEYAPAEHKLQPVELVAPAHFMQASYRQVTLVRLSAREKCHHLALSPATSRVADFMFD